MDVLFSGLIDANFITTAAQVRGRREFNSVDKDSHRGWKISWGQARYTTIYMLGRYGFWTRDMMSLSSQLVEPPCSKLVHVFRWSSGLAGAPLESLEVLQECRARTWWGGTRERPRKSTRECKNWWIMIRIYWLLLGVDLTRLLAN